MGLKVTVTFEAQDKEKLLDAVDAFTDEMFEKFDAEEMPSQLGAADGDNWSYTVEATKKD
jgi:hypothetical protein